MTVAELRAALADAPDEALVFVYNTEWDKTFPIQAVRMERGVIEVSPHGAFPHEEVWFTEDDGGPDVALVIV